MDTHIEQSLEALHSRHINGVFAENSEEGRRKILDLIPLDAVVGIGDSTALRQMGLPQILKERFTIAEPTTLESIDINLLLSEELLKAKIPENIKVTTKLDEIPSMLLDREQIRRVFQNILLNAVQAMPEGGTLRVSTWLVQGAADSAPASVVVEIQDVGQGIAGEVLGKG